MAAIDETAAVQNENESVEFLTAEDLQGITGQLDQLLAGQASLESKFDLYTGNASDKLTNLDNNIKEIRDFLLETEEPEEETEATPEEPLFDYTSNIDQINGSLLQVNENLQQISQQLNDLTVYHSNLQNVTIPLLCTVSIVAGLLVALIFTNYLKH